MNRVQKNIDWTPEDRERHKSIREQFAGRPTVDALVVDGELTGQTTPLGVYLNLRSIVRNLRTLREQAQLSLTDISERSGMDKAMVSRLENGHVPNPGLETISRYLDAMGKTLEWRVVDAAAA